MPYFGACFGSYFVEPYRPPMDVPEDVINMAMRLEAQQIFIHVRTCSCQGGYQYNVKLARKHGLKVALGIYVVPGEKLENWEAIQDDWRQVAAFPGANVSVTSCFSGTVFVDSPDWASAVDACEEVVYLTVYPRYGDAAPTTSSRRWIGRGITA